MIGIDEIKAGRAILVGDEPYMVLSHEHSKTGRAGAVLRTKLKNLAKGNPTERTFRAGEKVERVTTNTGDMQFLYEDGAQLVLMNNETYEQVNVDADGVENGDLLAPNAQVQVLFIRDAPFRVELPTFVELTVTRCDPGAKGDTVSNVMKPAQVETGATVNVPLFVNEGDKIRIDTRSREYAARA